MNLGGMRAVYAFQFQSHFRYPLSFLSPLVSTTLYFVVFGTQVGSAVMAIGGVDYASYIVPGLIMMSLYMDTIVTSAYTILGPKISGSIYETLSAPLSPLEIVVSHIGSAATKSVILGLLTLLTARFFVSFNVAHPLYMICFLILASVSASLLGLIIGVLVKSWHSLNIATALIVTPMAFLGGSFYSLSALPAFWRKVALFDPVVYVVNEFRWSFFDIADVRVEVSCGATMALSIVTFAVAIYMFKTGYGLKS